MGDQDVCPGLRHPARVGGLVVGGGVRIGHRNVLREFTTLQQGHFGPTVLGDDGFLMTRVYVAHDSWLGDQVTMAAAASLGGHVHVGSGANLGLGAVVHQRRVIGPGAMVGMGAVVTRDIPPYPFLDAIHPADETPVVDVLTPLLCADWAAGNPADTCTFNPAESP